MSARGYTAGDMMQFFEMATPRQLQRLQYNAGGYVTKSKRSDSPARRALLDYLKAEGRVSQML